MHSIGIALTIIGGLIAIYGYKRLCEEISRDAHATWHSWAVSSVLATVIAMGQSGLGLRWWELGITWAQVLGTAAVLVAALKQHADTHKPFNYLMLVVASVLIVLYATSDNNRLAVWLAIAADGVGMIPTVRDAYFKDKPFPIGPWIWDAVASLVGLCGVLMITFDSAQWGFAAYLLVINTVVIAARCHGLGWHRCHLHHRPHDYDCCKRVMIAV